MNTTATAATYEGRTTAEIAQLVSIEWKRVAPANDIATPSAGILRRLHLAAQRVNLMAEVAVAAVGYDGSPELETIIDTGDAVVRTHREAARRA